MPDVKKLAEINKALHAQEVRLADLQMLQAKANLQLANIAKDIRARTIAASDKVPSEAALDRTVKDSQEHLDAVSALNSVNRDISLQCADIAFSQREFEIAKL